jgi:putative acyl-CoA dehydrogenase
MSALTKTNCHTTHDVVNQPRPLGDYNLFTTDPALREGVARYGGGWGEAELAALGQEAGRQDSFEDGRLANTVLPVLKAYDRYGNRRDEVEFHPSWHQAMRRACAEGLQAAAWSDPRPGSHVVRAAKYIMLAQVECGSLCPVTMTFAAIPTLRLAPALFEEWRPKLLSGHYDPRFRPVAEKTGCLIGMGLTEKQGGSDVRSNSTIATPLDGEGDQYSLVGHKWFLSAPMCDGFLVTARAPGGMTCFFLPRWRPDGSLNALRICRLKDKLGNKSNASSEVEFEDAWAVRVGEEGRGIATIIEMASLTRLDCILGTTGAMRQALTQAVHHARNRSAFQRRLVDQPLMRAVLADLAIEVEAAMALGLRLAQTFDEPADAALRRLMTPAGKYWVCKRGPTFAAEAMEVLGGIGYVEDSNLARIYREMPVNSIWEGSGNVMCLDALRALSRTPEAKDALLDEVKPARGLDRRFDRFAAGLDGLLAEAGQDEGRARWVVERLVLALQGALLLRHGAPAVAEAFCASRLAGDWGATLGTLPRGLDLGAVLERVGDGQGHG